MWSSVARFHLFSDFLEDMRSRWCCLHPPKEGRTAAVDGALSGESCANLSEEDEKGSELLCHQHHQYLPDLSPALWLQSSDFRCEWKMPKRKLKAISHHDRLTKRKTSFHVVRKYCC